MSPSLLDTPEKRRRHYQATKRWAAANPDKTRKIQKRYRERHRELLNAKGRAYMAANPERDRAVHCRWRAANIVRVHEIARKSRLACKFNLTPAEYDAKLLGQGGRCAICGKAPSVFRRLAIDHDHKTRQVELLGWL